MECFLCTAHRLSWEIDTIISPILQVKKLRLREGGHSFRVIQRMKAVAQDLNSCPLGSSTQAFPVTRVVMPSCLSSLCLTISYSSKSPLPHGPVNQSGQVLLSQQKPASLISV